jgi:hypothetical protein
MTHHGPPACETCHDRGWIHHVKATAAGPRSYVARCLCAAGTARRDDIKRIDEVPGFDEPGRLEALYPAGLPDAAVGLLTPGMLARANVPVVMREWTLDTHPDPALVRKAGCHEWLAQRAPTDLVFLGRAGAGKTGLAVGLLRTWLERRLGSALYVYAPEWLLDVQASFKRDDVTERDALAGVREADLLVLDDLNARRWTEYYADTLTTVLSVRINAARRTIITANFSFADLETLLPGMLFDRVRSKATFYDLDAESGSLRLPVGMAADLFEAGEPEPPDDLEPSS